ncbi:MAG TPA: UvrD-helicase domain-containing protein [Planctomycetota bacterium]|jgi:exodeoxyribonuclease V beta subunit
MSASELNSHQIVEASAGTGKTYKIKNLVVNLLASKEARCTIDKLLVLTFTEAATSELKAGVRESIEKALQTGKIQENGRPHTLDVDQIKLLRDALNNYDQGAISTIHSFCQRALQQYAFENGEQFKLEVVDDTPIFERFLNEHIRERWPEFGARLPALLKLSGYDDTCRERMLKVLTVWQRGGENEDMLEPSGEKPPDEAVFFPAVREACAEIVSQVNGFDPNDPEANRFTADYRALNINGTSTNSKVPKFITPLLLLAHKAPQRADGLWEFLSESISAEDFIKEGFERPLITEAKWNKSANRAVDSATHLQRWRKLYDAAERLRPVLFAAPQLLYAWTIREVYEKTQAYKREHGVISFNDMLMRLAEALRREDKQSVHYLRDALRAQFRYGLVDEFQDTDRIQWEILERIFIRDKKPNQPPHLLVVGDPKQAIYRFRQADVEIYLAAKQSMQAGAKAKFTYLDTNWRSDKDLLDALDLLFKPANDGGAGWFDAGQAASLPSCEFKSVSARPTEKNALPNEGKNLPSAVTVINCNNYGNCGPAREDYATFVAAEIKALLRGGMRIREKDDAAYRPLNARDIFILVRKRSEAEPFENALASAKIPFSFYKKDGIYESQEATSLSLMLDALADPHNTALMRQALLTPFLRIYMGDLPHFDELQPEHPVKYRLARWRHLAERREWSVLFQSLLEDTGVLWLNEERHLVAPPGPPLPWEVARLCSPRPFAANSSVPAPDAGTTAPSVAERRAANYLQLTEALERAARCEHLDIHELALKLRRWRAGSESMGQDQDLHRIESEDAKVQIMTVHASKGLQAPIVFLAAGFTSGKQRHDFRKYHSGNRVVFDLTNSPEAKNAADREDKCEERRLFYVALTRAKHCLYVPFLEERRSSGPLCNDLAPAIKTAWIDRNPRPARLAVRELREELSRIHAEKEQIGSTPAADAAAVLEFSAQSLQPEAVPLHRLARRMRSFSRLSKSHSVRYFGEEKWQSRNDEDLKAVALPTGPAAKNDPEEDIDLPEPPELQPDELPPGVNSGQVLHDVLERVDFREALSFPGDLPADRSPMGGLITQAMQDWNVNEPPEAQKQRPYARQVAQMVRSALKVDLLGDGWRLGNLEEKDRVSELEFHYPLPQPIRQRAAPGIEIDELGFLNGFVDLVFRHDGKYFILDWKSNRLLSYEHDMLDRCMKKHRYKIQYWLYTLAVARWLEQAGLDYEKSFGGVVYVFLRGLGKGRAGLYVDRDVKPVREIEDKLFTMLNYTREEDDSGSEDEK